VASCSRANVNNHGNEVKNELYSMGSQSRKKICPEYPLKKWKYISHNASTMFL